MNKHTGIALLFGACAAIGTTTAFYGLNGMTMESFKADPIVREHVLEVTSFYATHAYRSDNYDKDFLIGTFENPGSYFLMNPVFENAKYSTDGHLIDAMCSVSSDNFFLQVSYPGEETHYYLTAEDRVNDKRLNVVGFSKLKRVQLFMDKELNQVGFNITKIEKTNKVSCTQTEDAQNTIYTLTYNLDGGFADSCDTYYFWLSEGFADKRFVLNKIVFIYDC